MTLSKATKPAIARGSKVNRKNTLPSIMLLLL